MKISSPSGIKQLEKWAGAESIVYGDKVYTYADVDALSNKVASWASERLNKGDTCALFMENRPEFIISWLGLAKRGVKVAMINTSIKKKGLKHCISVSECKAVLFGGELSTPIAEIADQLPNHVAFYGVTDGGAAPASSHSKFQIVDDAIASASAAPPPPGILADVGMPDIFGYIYTSGTTGLPKAAKILHSKMVSFGGFMVHGCDIRPGDRNYCVLPLFHSAGGGLGVGMMIYGGATIIIKRKFSARSFWSDCIKYNATVTQYIGELARYLVANPPSSDDTKHFHPRRRRQRNEARGVGYVPGSLSHTRNWRILRRHGRQRCAAQSLRHSRRPRRRGSRGVAHAQADGA